MYRSMWEQVRGTGSTISTGTNPGCCVTRGAQARPASGGGRSVLCWGTASSPAACCGQPPASHVGSWPSRLQAMDEMIDKLVFVSKDNLTYIAEYDRQGRPAVPAGGPQRDGAELGGRLGRARQPRWAEGPRCRCAATPTAPMPSFALPAGTW